MTDRSFQNEVPPARINIQLSVDRGNAQKKTELPLKLLVLGDFTRRREETRVAEREKISVNRDNFDRVMESLGPEVKMVVPDRLREGRDLHVSLKFDSMKSFEPAEIVRQVPELSRLMAARNLIRDLGSNLLDNREFRKRMEAVLNDRTAMQTMLTDLDALAPERKEPTDV